MRIAWHGMYPEEDKFVLNCLCLSESNKIWKEPREIGEIIGYLIILAQSSDEYPSCNCWRPLQREFPYILFNGW